MRDPLASLRLMKAVERHRHTLQEGLLLNAPRPGCLRFTPALTVSRANVDEMLKRLSRAFALAKSKPLESA